MPKYYNIQMVVVVAVWFHAVFIAIAFLFAGLLACWLTGWSLKVDVITVNNCRWFKQLMFVFFRENIGF